MGVIDDSAVLDLRQLGFPSILELLRGPLSVQDGYACVLSLAYNLTPCMTVEQIGQDGVEWLPPIPHPPRNVFCLGVNFAAHVEEGQRPPGTTVPDVPVYFTKPYTSFVAHGDVVHVPIAATAELDWEAEIAFVLSRGGHNIPRAKASQHVFGITLANDISARDVQRRAAPFSQWFKGKSLDGSLPLGPLITPVCELEDYEQIEFGLRVNGVEKQRAHIADMVHKIASVVEDLSNGMTLLAGDIVLSGTPSGVGMWREPQEFLVDGDEVEVFSTELGNLCNRIVRS